MEENSSSQPPKVPVHPQSIQSPEPTIAPVNNEKGFFPIILGVLVLLIVVVGGTYYLGRKNTQTSTSFLPTTSVKNEQPTQSPTVATDKCNEQRGDFFSTKLSQQSGWCELFKQYKGYTIIYPDIWKVTLVGANGENLLFNEGIKTGNAQELFILTTSTTLPLEQADKATYSYEMVPTQPLVNTKEEIVNKKIENVGDKRVLNLVTKQDGNLIQRYFLLHKDKENGYYTDLYMFKTSGDNEVLLADLKQMISSMKFVK